MRHAISHVPVQTLPQTLYGPRLHAALSSKPSKPFQIADSINVNPQPQVQSLLEPTVQVDESESLDTESRLREFDRQQAGYTWMRGYPGNSFGSNGAGAVRGDESVDTPKKSKSTNSTEESNAISSTTSDDPGHIVNALI